MVSPEAMDALDNLFQHFLEGLLEVLSFLKRNTKITHLLSDASIVPYLCDHVISVAVGCPRTLIRKKYTDRKTILHRLCILIFPANIYSVVTQLSNNSLAFQYYTISTMLIKEHNKPPEYTEQVSRNA